MKARLALLFARLSLSLLNRLIEIPEPEPEPVSVPPVPLVSYHAGPGWISPGLWKCSCGRVHTIEERRCECGTWGVH